MVAVYPTPYDFKNATVEGLLTINYTNRSNLAIGAGETRQLAQTAPYLLRMIPMDETGWLRTNMHGRHALHALCMYKNLDLLFNDQVFPSHSPNSYGTLKKFWEIAAPIIKREVDDVTFKALKETVDRILYYSSHAAFRVAAKKGKKRFISP